jgi:hypothetical protein
MRIEIVDNLITYISRQAANVKNEYEQLRASDSWKTDGKQWNSYAKGVQGGKVKAKLESYKEILLEIKRLKQKYEID